MESSANRGKTEGETVNLWTELLSKTIKGEDKDANVLVVGNFDCGKKTLVTAIQKAMGFKVLIESRNENSVIYTMKDKKNVGAFDFSYISIKNPADDSVELGKINFWVANEKIPEEILQQILTAKRLSRFAILLVLDFERLRELEEDLDKWLTFINQKIPPLFNKLFDLKSMDAFRNRLTDLVMNYMDPTTTPEGKIINRKVELNPDLADKLYVPEGVLQPNYGFPIIVALNKSDHILEVRKERSPDEIFDMVECTLRKRACPYAASVMYTSTKMEKNIKLLADYLNFLFFNVPFEHPNNLAKDNLFIPIGFDNADVIKTAYGAVMDKTFASVIPKKKEASKLVEREFFVKPNQKFLEELRELAAPLQSTRTIDNVSMIGGVSNAGTQQGGINEGPRPSVRFSKEYRERIMNVLNRNPNGAPGNGPANPPVNTPVEAQANTPANGAQNGSGSNGLPPAPIA